jgi:hypothetical protein
MRKDGRAQLADRLAAELRQRNQSALWLAGFVGVSENQINRILNRPQRKTTPDTWLRIARGLGWDERETVLLSADLVPYTEHEDTDPLAVIAAQLRRLGVTEARCTAVMDYVRLAALEARNTVAPS